LQHASADDASSAWPNDVQVMHNNLSRSGSSVLMIESLNGRNISYSFNVVFGIDAEAISGHRRLHHSLMDCASIGIAF
jgi:hypothetical protein